VSREGSFFFLFSSFLFSQGREAEKTGLVLFHEAMVEFKSRKPKKSFKRFKRAAVKGHEESIWILSAVEDVEGKDEVWKEAFAKTEKPMGWYFAGKLSKWKSREQFDFHEKSAEGGSWGQVAYGWYFCHGEFVEKDEKVYVEWLEKAASQKNPKAMHWLGNRFRYEGGDDMEKSVSYFRDAAELGWKSSMSMLAEMLRNGEGCVKDLRQAVIWGAKGGSRVFWKLLREARRALESGTTEALGCDFNQLCYTIGWGLYWYEYGSKVWKKKSEVQKAFDIRCLDYYCSCVELQQNSIFTFLLFWNRTTGGVKGPGQMIAQMMWERREDNLGKKFEQNSGEEPQMKRIKQ
jgi:hypothetical protein